jgi:excisionase family DNA binding protein
VVGDGSQLRTEEVAELLNLSKSTVINYANEGLLRVRRTRGRHRRFPLDSVHELQAILDMDEGPDQDAAFDALRRRNRGDEPR